MKCQTGCVVLVAILALAGCAPPTPWLWGSLPGLSATSAPPETALESNWYRVYFTQPALTASLANPTGGIPDQIAVSFDAAQRSIDLAIYQFDLPPLAAALVRAQARGVQVRVVTDSDSLDMDGLRTLAQAGVPVVPDNRQPIMHDKFAVVDGALVWTGSMNYTYSDAYRHDNNVIEIRSAELAQQAHRLLAR